MTRCELTANNYVIDGKIYIRVQNVYRSDIVLFLSDSSTIPLCRAIKGKGSVKVVTDGYTLTVNFLAIDGKRKELYDAIKENYRIECEANTYANNRIEIVFQIMK